MNKKTIVISEDVYERLDEERRSGEEFEDTIDRLIGYRPLSDFFGAWMMKRLSWHGQLSRQVAGQKSST